MIDVIRKDPALSGVNVVATFKVEVELGGRERSYHAAVLFNQIRDCELRPLAVVDYVVQAASYAMEDLLKEWRQEPCKSWKS